MAKNVSFCLQNLLSLLILLQARKLSYLEKQNAISPQAPTE